MIRQKILLAYKGNEKDFKFGPALDQELKETDKKVTVTYGGKETVIDITVQPKQVTVTFIVDGQENPVKVVKGQSIGALMPKDPSKEGYTFKGWNTKKDGSGEVVTADTVVKEDLSVYAIFEKGGTPANRENQASREILPMVEVRGRNRDRMEMLSMVPLMIKLIL